MRIPVFLLSLIMLASCSSLPRPPVVDGSNRQAINTPDSAKVIALQAHLLKTERQMEQPQPEIPPTAISQTVSIHFPFNVTTFRISAGESAYLSSLLHNAHRIEIRGRTDGNNPNNVADEKIALGRALAAQRYLIGQGVSSAIISINYVSAGDYVADNFSTRGRSQNRRVEIEVFRK